jgi:hypothetical protein
MKNPSPLITGHGLGMTPADAPLEFVSDQLRIDAARAGISALKAKNAEASALSAALAEDDVPSRELWIGDLS